MAKSFLNSKQPKIVECVDCGKPVVRLPDFVCADCIEEAEVTREARRLAVEQAEPHWLGGGLKRMQFGQR